MTSSPSRRRRHATACVAKCSRADCETQGKRIFRDALEDGSVESFFPLVQHFQTQSEPASCALGTLSMVGPRCPLLCLHPLTRRVQVLNALGIDPALSWKGPWRWWSEEVRVRTHAHAHD